MICKYKQSESWSGSILPSGPSNIVVVVSQHTALRASGVRDKEVQRETSTRGTREEMRMAKREN